MTRTFSSYMVCTPGVYTAGVAWAMLAGAQPDDPWFARLAFRILHVHGPWWVTLWLVLIMGGLVALVVVAGPWVSGVVTAGTALTATGGAVARTRQARRTVPPVSGPETASAAP